MAVFLARMVMPFSRSRSPRSMISRPTSWLSLKVWLCLRSASTRVVLPWSTWAMMATFRRSWRMREGTPKHMASRNAGLYLLSWSDFCCEPGGPRGWSPPGLWAAPGPAPPAPRAPATLRFPLVAVSELVTGQVVIIPGAGSYQLTVNARGLPPGSVHSVHLHFGSCPSTGVHLAVLGTLVADGGGSGSMIVTVSRSYSGSGRFVIVYLGPSAGGPAGCSPPGCRAPRSGGLGRPPPRPRDDAHPQQP